RSERVRKRFRVGADVGEEERAPGIDRNRDEAELVLREIRLLVAARRIAEAAVEPVGPRVVRALQGLAAALPFGERVTAVAADGDEPAQHAVAIARHDDGRPGDLGGEVARLPELPGVADVLPGRAEDPLLLPTQDLRVRVPGVR